MQPHEVIRARTDALSQLIETRLGVRGRGLAKKLKGCRGVMPAWVRREAMQLAEAEALLTHPKLMVQADPAVLEQSFRRCEAWLKGVDPAERRRHFWLNVLAVNAFNLLVLGGVLVATLRLLQLV